MQNNNGQIPNITGDYRLMKPMPETPEELCILPEEQATTANDLEFLITNGLSVREEETDIANDLLEKEEKEKSVIICSLSEEEEKTACDWLISLRIRYLSAICTNESWSGIKWFCEHNETLLNCWRRRLREHTHPDFAYSFVDKSGSVNEFSMMMGCYYFARFNLWKELRQQNNQSVQYQETFLNMACDRGDPFALREREKRYAAVLSALCRTAREEGEGYTVYADDFALVVHKMLELAEEWGNRCWSPGFFSAGVILEESAVELAGNDGQAMALERLTLSAPEKQYPLCLLLMAGAMRCYYSAWLLAEQENSVRLMKVVSPDGYFTENSTPDWEALQRSISRKLERNFKVRMPEILAERTFSQVMEKLERVLQESVPESESEPDSGNRHSSSL